LLRGASSWRQNEEELLPGHCLRANEERLLSGQSLKKNGEELPSEAPSTRKVKKNYFESPF